MEKPVIFVCGMVFRTAVCSRFLPLNPIDPDSDSDGDADNTWEHLHTAESTITKKSLLIPCRPDGQLQQQLDGTEKESW